MYKRILKPSFEVYVALKVQCDVVWWMMRARTATVNGTKGMREALRYVECDIIMVSMLKRQREAS